MADTGNVIVWIDNRTTPQIQAQVKQLQQGKYPDCKLHYLNPRFFEHPQTVGLYWSKVVAVIIATSSRAVHEGYRILFAGDAAGTLTRPLYVLGEKDAPKAGKPLTSPIPEEVPAMRCLVYIDPTAPDNSRADHLHTQARQQFPGLSLMEQSAPEFGQVYMDRVAGVVVEDRFPHIAQAYQDKGIEVRVIQSPDTPGDTVDVESAKAILSLPLASIEDLLFNTDDPLFLVACADLEMAGANRPEVHQLLHNRLKELGSTNPHLGNMRGKPPEGPETGQGEESGGEGESEAPETAERPLRAEMEALAQRTVEGMKEVLPALTIDQCIELYAAEERGRSRVGAMRAIQEQMEKLAKAK